MADLKAAIPDLAYSSNWHLFPANMSCNWEFIECADNETRVEKIEFSYAGRPGTIPDSIANLTSLRILNLAGNRFNGTLPAGLATLQLEEINIDGNPFTSPFPSTLLGISSLKKFVFVDNQFSGSWPSLWSSSIEVLHIENAGFSGPFQPPMFPSMTNLKELTIARSKEALNNSLVGHPLFNVASLQVLQVSSNLIDEVGVPTVCPALYNLKVLRWSDNTFRGAFPSLSCATGLTTIDFRNTFFLEGVLPVADLVALPLEELVVEGNQLTGEIPEDLIRPNLTILRLASNLCVVILFRGEDITFSHFRRSGSTGPIQPPCGLRASLNTFSWGARK